MKSTTKYISAACAMVLGASCGSQSANYCEDAPFHNCMNQVDAAPDAPTGCKAAPDKCTGTTPACDMVADKCVECTTASHALCTGLEPVCGGDATCRGCTTHSECTSEVCMPDGSCAAEGDVAYVNGTAGAGTACTKAAPCKTLTAAVGTTKAIVKVKGMVNDRVSIGRTVKIFADADGELRSSSNGALLTTTGSAIVDVYDLAIADASGVNVGYGVQVGANTTFNLTRGKVSGCREAGIASTGGSLMVTASTISSNKGGGVSLANASFKLTNNVIAENGDASAGGSTFGGVSLTSTANDNVFEQNTVVFNHSLIGNPGASCSAVAAFHGRRNIITSNNLGLTFPATQSAGCADLESYTAAGSSANDLGFAAIAPAPINFHLTAASPATVRDVAGVTTCSGVDIDGDSRPLNTFCDFGADEFKP